MPDDLLDLLSELPQGEAVLAAQLDTDTDTLRGWAAQLRRRGVPLSISALGYALAPGTPSRAAMRAAGLSRPYRYCAQVGSTQDELRRWADDPHDPAPPGAVLLAESQTHGRGRRGRHWHTQPGAALTFSVLLPASPPPQLRLLPLAVGLALREACAAALPPGTPLPALKWPNDLLTPSGQKLAGSLLETEWRGSLMRRAVLGIGLNVQAAPPGAACLADLATGQVLSRSAVLSGILAALERWLSADQPEVLRAWRGANMTLGQQVQVQTLSGIVSGIAQALSDEGDLLLTLPSGDTLSIGAGDVALIGKLEAAP